MENNPESPQHFLLVDKPWYRPPPPVLKAGDHVAVIGAGIAGCTSAFALARRGIKVTLFERRPKIASETSGHPAVVLMPMISISKNPVGVFYLAAYHAAMKRLDLLIKQDPSFNWSRTGVVQLMINERWRRVYDRLSELNLPDEVVQAIDGQGIQEKTGMDLADYGLYYPNAGWLDARDYCRAHLRHTGIILQTNFPVTKLEKAKEGNWLIHGENTGNPFEAKAVVLANAADALNFEHTNWLPFKRVRGQLAFVDKERTPIYPKTVVFHDGYWIPNCNGQHILGATFDKHENSKRLLPHCHEMLIQNALQHLKGLSYSSPPPLKGRVAFRARTHDHLPLVGPVPDREWFLDQYGDLHHGRKHKFYPAASYIPGLYVTVGHASRGMTSTTLASELLAAQMCGGECPIESDLVNELSPARFIVRDLVKGR